MLANLLAIMLYMGACLGHGGLGFEAFDCCVVSPVKESRFIALKDSFSPSIQEMMSLTNYRVA